MKYVAGFSSGSTIKIAHLLEQNFSASIAVSKHKICSSSESRKALSRDIAVDMMDAIACSLVLSAAPANHLVLWSGGNFSISN